MKFLEVEKFFFFGWMACGILVPWPVIEPGPPQWKRWVLNTRPPGNSRLLLLLFLKNIYSWRCRVLVAVAARASLVAVSGGFSLRLLLLLCSTVSRVVAGKPRWVFEKHFDTLSPDIRGPWLDPKACWSSGSSPPWLWVFWWPIGHGWKMSV